MPPQLGVMQGISKLALPQASTIENLSYGNQPFTMPPSGTGAMIPQAKTGRKPEIADLVSMISGVPGAGAVADVGTKLSNEAADALVRAITRNPQATAPGVLQEAGQMAPLSRIFIGAKSKLWNKDAAKEFLNLEKKGVAPQEAWQKTGTFRSPDGKLRQEISDDKSVARFDMTTQETQKELDAFSKLEYGKGWKELDRDQKNDIFSKFEQVRSNLPSKLTHEDLYRAYPDLATMRSGASYSEIPHGEYMLSETFDGASKIPQKVYESIFVGGPDVGTVRSSLLHEAQHAIQRREGFERGGSMQAAEELLQKNPSLAHKPMAAYRRFAGEAEARAVQNRMDMTPEQRLARFPLESYDVGIKELIMRSLLD